MMKLYPQFECNKYFSKSSFLNILYILHIDDVEISAFHSEHYSLGFGP